MELCHHCNSHVNGLFIKNEQKHTERGKGTLLTRGYCQKGLGGEYGARPYL